MVIASKPPRELNDGFRNIGIKAGRQFRTPVAEPQALAHLSRYVALPDALRCQWVDEGKRVKITIVRERRRDESTVEAAAQGQNTLAD